MDIKHVLSRTPFGPAYRHRAHEAAADPGPMGWVEREGGLVEIGTSADHFHFDNEGPRHQVWLEPYRLADRLVTAGEWLAFMDDGGYSRAPLWLSEGWYTVQREGWEAPMYWFRDGGDWQVHTLAGPRPVDPHEPVCHVSSFEAHAYAEWAGLRLPTESEWEHAAADAPVEGAFLDLDVLHPRGATGPGLRQVYGDVWEQTSSAYLPYPGFQAPEGAIGEYNGKFMSNQMVLRGGCAFTPRGHTRSTYRNFFPSHSRWMLSGVRLAGGPES
jgi:ergothioneine biosynthesis protein EgtB